MNLHRVSTISFFILGACSYPLNGQWEGVERHIVEDGSVTEKLPLPYEECYPDFDEQTQELSEESSTCIERSFFMDIQDVDEIIFEAGNNLNEGQLVSLSTTGFSGDSYQLSDGNRFAISCRLDTSGKVDLLYCDFTSTIGYLKDSRIVFTETK